MSAGIAHELNQPLNAIKMGSDFLGMMVEQQREIPPRDLHQVVAEMSTQVDRAAEIINTLRSFGRKAELVMERVDINKPIQAVFSLVGRQFELENIRMESIRPGSIPSWHDNRLQQVLQPGHQRDAMSKRRLPGRAAGKILIRTYQEGEHVGGRRRRHRHQRRVRTRSRAVFSTKESSIDGPRVGHHLRDRQRLRGRHSTGEPGRPGTI
jgi:C4-dicarboxylate-specific signal transduction histidine kinase